MEGRPRESMRRVLIRAEYLFFLIQWLVIFIIALAGINYDRPSRRENGLVDVEVIGFEGIASEDGRNGDGLAIG